MNPEGNIMDGIIDVPGAFGTYTLEPHPYADIHYLVSPQGRHVGTLCIDRALNGERGWHWLLQAAGMRERPSRCMYATLARAAATLVDAYERNIRRRDKGRIVG